MLNGSLNFELLFMNEKGFAAAALSRPRKGFGGICLGSALCSVRDVAGATEALLPYTEALTETYRWASVQGDEAVAKQESSQDSAAVSDPKPRVLRSFHLF